MSGIDAELDDMPCNGEAFFASLANRPASLSFKEAIDTHDIIDFMRDLSVPPETPCKGKPAKTILHTYEEYLMHSASQTRQCSSPDLTIKNTTRTKKHTPKPPTVTAFKTALASAPTPSSTEMPALPASTKLWNFF